MVIQQNVQPDLLPETSTGPAIKSQLDAFAAGRRTAEELTEQLVHLCGGHTEAAWEALSLLDQYNRRGLLPGDLFREIKAAIHAVVFGAPVAATAGGTAVRPQPNAAPSAVIEERSLSDSRDSDESESAEELDEAADELTDATESESNLGSPARQQPASATIIIGPTHREPLGPVAANSSAQPRAGAILCGRYVLIAPLGRGGMSTVFKALDQERSNLPEHDRYVAVKMLREELTARPEARAALQREFRQAQSLSHPNIVNVYDCERHGDSYFIVMELLQGELLARVLERIAPRRLGVSHSLAIVREIGVALAHAHDHGIVHADLKPGNVMITDEGELRVLDFGLSSSLLQDPWISDEHEPRELVAVTPGYCSPERMQGLRPDPRDDLYGLASIAFELLTGEQVFQEGKHLSGREIRQRLSQTSEISKQQCLAISRGLAPTRARRTPTVRAWLAEFDLRQAAYHLPPVRDLRGESSTARKQRPWKIVFALLLLVAAAALISRVLLQNFSSGNTWPSTHPVTDAERETPQPTTGPVKADEVPASTVPQRKSAVSAPNSDTSAPVISASVPVAGEPRAKQTPPNVVEVTKYPIAPASLGFTQDQYSVAASASVARLTVHRNGPLNQETIFHWRTVGGSAKPEHDYVSFDDAAERFAPGQRTATILVPIVNDSARRATEYFEVELTDASHASLGPIPRATVVIISEE